MSVQMPLDSMSVAEKVQLLEAVWASLCQKTSDVLAPDWHQQVLAERTQRINSGDAIISPWTEAKARLLRLGQ